MWHEARKQERMIRGMIVDYRRRAERRKDFYEKIKAEPTQFLQLHGRPCKIHLDPAVAAAGDSPVIMMPWQGDSNSMIDRFDVRAHLDYIPDVKVPNVPLEELSQEERQCNYERYRILAQNNFLGVGEDKFLHQLAVEEKFGVTMDEKESFREKSNEKKGTGAAIGYNYNDPGSQPSTSTGPDIKTVVEKKDSDDESDFEIIDVDLSIDVNKMEASQAHELNAVGPMFGMAGCDLFSFLTGDADEAEHQKQLLREEKEKAMYSGRKSRRERRAHRDKKLVPRCTSPPSYAAPTTETTREPSRSVSRSPEPRDAGSIQFITSFGGEEEDAKYNAPKSNLSYSDKVKLNLKKSYSEIARAKKSIRPPLPEEKSSYKTVFEPQRPKDQRRSSPHSRSRSHSRSRPRMRGRSYSRSRSHSLSRLRSRSRSNSRSFSPRRRRSSSRSRSRSRSSRDYKRRSRSRSVTNQDFSRRNHSRSVSTDSNKNNGVETKAIPRYYGRKKEDNNSSSEPSLDSDSSQDDTEDKAGNGGITNTTQSQLRSGSSNKGLSRETLTMKEKLKRKMQAQLSRQLRADKQAEAMRRERESRRQARREHEMRELALKLRRRQREMRHQQNIRSSDDDSDRSRSRSSSRESHERNKSRSRSPTPPRKHVPPKHTDYNTESTSEKRDQTLGESSHTQVNKYHKYPPYEVPREENRYQRQDDRPHSYSSKYNEDHDRPRFQNYPPGPGQGYTPRWRHDSQNYHRRPYGHRGGYRGSGRRYDQSYERNYDERPNNWQSNRQYEHNDDHRDDSSKAYNKNRVKLVDY